MALGRRRREPPLDVFTVKCPGCNRLLKVVRSRTLKTKRENQVTLYCDTCRARYRLRLEKM